MIVYLDDPYSKKQAGDGKERMLCLGGVCDGRTIYGRPNLTPFRLFECQRVDVAAKKCLPPPGMSSTRYVVMPLHVSFEDMWRGGTTDNIPSSGNILLADGLDPLEAIARLVSNYPEATLIGGTP